MSTYFARSRRPTDSFSANAIGQEVVSATAVKFPAVRSVLWTRDSEHSDLILGWRNFAPDIAFDHRFLSALAKASSVLQPSAAVEQMVFADANVTDDCVLLMAPQSSKSINKYNVCVRLPSDQTAAAGALAACRDQKDEPEQPLCISLSYRTETGLSGGRQFELHISARVPALTLHVRTLSYPPSPLPTPLLHALVSGPMSALHTEVPGCQHGACTMDAARRTVLLAADDPTALSVPIVGFWFRLTCAPGQDGGEGEGGETISGHGLYGWAEQAVRHPCFRAACTWAGYTARFGERVHMPGLPYSMLAVLLPPPGSGPGTGTGTGMGQQVQVQTVEVTTAWPRVEGGVDTIPASSAVTYAGLGQGSSLTPSGWVHIRASCWGTLLPSAEGGWAVQGRTVGTDVGKVAVQGEGGNLHWALIPGSEYLRKPMPAPTPSRAVGQGGRRSSEPSLAQTLIARTLAHVDAHAAGTPSRIPVPRSPPATATPRVHPRESSSPSLTAWKRLTLTGHEARVRAIQAEGAGAEGTGVDQQQEQRVEEEEEVSSRAAIAGITAQLSELTTRLRGQADAHMPRHATGTATVGKHTGAGQEQTPRTPPASTPSVVPHTFRAASTPGSALGLAAAGDMRARLEAMSSALHQHQHTQVQGPLDARAGGARLQGMLLREAASHMPGGTLGQAGGLSTALRATLSLPLPTGTPAGSGVQRVHTALPFASPAFQQSQRKDNPYLRPDYTPSPAATAASLLSLPRDRGYDAATSRQEAVAGLLRMEAALQAHAASQATHA